MLDAPALPCYLGSMAVLAGDIGGTRVRLAVYCDTRLQARTELDSADYHDPRLALRRGLDLLRREHSDLEISAVALGVAGPVRDNRCTLTNLGWELHPVSLREVFGDVPAALYNDLACAAVGAHAGPRATYRQLIPGVAVCGASSLTVGIGTGLGAALVVPQTTGWKVLASEAGHQGFAPETPQQLALYRSLGSRGRVTWEDVVSGPGLRRLFAFAARDPHGDDVAATLEAPSAAQIHAHATKSPTCAQACQLLGELAGSFVGNLALTCLPRGGIFVTGGVARHLQSYLASPVFTAAMTHKPPMQTVLAELPVWLVDDPDVGLRGAALLATSGKPNE